MSGRAGRHPRVPFPVLGSTSPHLTRGGLSSSVRADATLVTVTGGASTCTRLSPALATLHAMSVHTAHLPAGAAPPSCSPRSRSPGETATPEQGPRVCPRRTAPHTTNDRAQSSVLTPATRSQRVHWSGR